MVIVVHGWSRATIESCSLLDEIVREEAARMLQAAIDAEVTDFLARHSQKVDDVGRRQVVRNGFLPPREILSGVGQLRVQQPRVRDRSADDGSRVVFTPQVVPPYLKRTAAVEELIAWLWFKGVSTGDFSDALQDGYRESEQCWKEPLLDAQQRGLKIAPKLAVGDGALGFWAALRKIYPETKEQQCWFHKSGNVLSKLQKSVQPRAKDEFHEIWQAETRADANTAFDNLLEKYDAKYQAACECLREDRAALLAFYDFTAQYWAHLRTTNPIESTFATIRLRHRRTKGSGSRRTSLAMMFKLAESASKKWRRLRGHELITPVVKNHTITDGVVHENAA